MQVVLKGGARAVARRIESSVYVASWEEGGTLGRARRSGGRRGCSCEGQMRRRGHTCVGTRSDEGGRFCVVSLLLLHGVGVLRDRLDDNRKEARNAHVVQGADEVIKIVVVDAEFTANMVFESYRETGGWRIKYGRCTR